MAKKGKGGRSRRKFAAAVKRHTPRGGRMSMMFKTAVAVSAAALVGGAALNVVNTSRGKPAEGLTAGFVSGGAGLLLAFTLGIFKGTRQYVTPVLAGAAAVGVLNAASGPISRGSANIAKALLGDKAGGGIAGEKTGGTGEPQKQLPAKTPGGGGMKTVKQDKLTAGLNLASSLAQLGAQIAGNVKGGLAPSAGLTEEQMEVAAAAGLDDFDVGGAGDMDEDDAMGSEGLDDFSIVGSQMMGDD